jgi:urease accessory protein UreF
VPRPATTLPGDAGALLAHLSAPDGSGDVSLASLACPQRRIRSLPALRSFLEDYGRELLIPVELPAIRRAWVHASRYETRELIALDRWMANEPKLKEFAAASCRVGQRQLNRLRPLRDLRLVRRYREAIERGEAHGWHTLVYGVALSIFSLPLRQGLTAYASRTTLGFIEQAARPLALTAGQCADLHLGACARVPAALNSLLGLESGAGPKVVK